MQLSILLTLSSSVFAQSILEAIRASAEHTVLAGLLADHPAAATLLASSEDLTVFAPSNAAFTKYNATLSNPEMASLIQHHVVRGTEIGSINTPKVSMIQTLANDRILVNFDFVSTTISIKSGLTTATVTTTLKTTTGIVYSIDAVLTPPPSLSETVAEAGLNAFYIAMQDTDLVSDFDSLKDVTVFAPTDKAFEKFQEFVAINELDLPITLLSSILKSHVVPKVILTTDAKQKYESLVGTDIEMVSGAVVKARWASSAISMGDVLVEGGVVHIIDTVLTPDLRDLRKATIGSSDATTGSGQNAGFSLEVLKGNKFFLGLITAVLCGVL